MNSKRKYLKRRYLMTGDVSRRLNVSPERVRQYEQQGLLAAERTASGRRLFLESHVEQFQREREQARRSAVSESDEA